MDIWLDELQTAVHTLRAAPAAALVTRVRSDTRCRVLFWHAIRQPHRLPLSATTTAARHKTDGRRLEVVLEDEHENCKKQIMLRSQTGRWVGVAQTSSRLVGLGWAGLG